jgi:hypothetical protein
MFERPEVIARKIGALMKFVHDEADAVVADLPYRPDPATHLFPPITAQGPGRTFPRLEGAQNVA